MQQVGMRELRHRLRHYLGRVEAGESFDVTLFGRPVAHLGPIRTKKLTFADLVERGRITPAVVDDASDLPEPVAATTGTTATEALLAERRSDMR